MTHTVLRRTTYPDASSDPDNLPWRPVLLLAGVALPIGWLLLGLGVFWHVSLDPFVLGTLVLGMIVPALVITGRESGWAGVGALLTKAVRPPRPLGWVLAALLSIPVLSWLTAAAFGAAQPLTAALLGSVAVQFVSSLFIVNIWEEMVWMGFAQTRMMTRFGLVRGSLVTAALFAGIHLPLAFAGGFGSRAIALGVGTLVVTAVGLRLIFGYLSRWTGQGVLVVAIAHASYNVTGALLQPGYDLVRLLVVVVLAAIAALVTVRSTRPLKEIR